MPSTPQISTSQALESRLSLIMLMTVHGTTPKFSSMEVQHCTALIATSVAAIHWSITAPSFAIFIKAAAGTLLASTYFLIDASFACAVSSLSFMRSMRPSTSDRSSVSIEMPFDSRIFSL